MFSNCINTYEFVNLGITVPSLNLDYMLNDINTTFKKYREYIELGLGSLEGKDWNSDLIEKMKSSEYYSNLIYKEVNEQIKNNTEKAKNGSWINTTYINSLISKYPYTEKEYYDICDRLSNLKTFYMEDVFEYQIKEIAKFFLDNGYTEEEQDTFLELAYKQAFDLRDIRSLNYNIKQTKDLNIPFEKYPKEMHIYSVRLNYIENYIRRMSEPNINIVIDNESYSFAIENNKTTAI